MLVARHPLVLSTRADPACMRRRMRRAGAVGASLSAALCAGLLAAAVVVLGTAPAPARAQAVAGPAGGAPAWAALCRAELTRPAEVERAAAEFARAFPSAGWHEVLVTALPREVPAPVRASVVAGRGLDPLILLARANPGGRAAA
ncbi:hypothetical protein tb265_45000 [Gemmatimonadetes bacterium T265]|nr:hypothetical protein tb265_45000 [Gemmatimonadetes bacterium T265]